MRDDERPRRPLNRLLLVEIGIGLLLFGLAIYLYWIPAARAPFVPRWWSLPVLAGLFFGLLVVDRWRRRRGDVEARRAAVREVSEEAREQRERPAAAPAEVEPPPPNELGEGRDSRMEIEGLDPPRGPHYP
jgi:hypothetical protein